MKEITYTKPVPERTEDGSSTLRHEFLGELYHSRHGAWTESHYIFIENGLLPCLAQDKDIVRVFEMGFGSGLNAALTREFAKKEECRIEYTSVELYPVAREVIRAMEFPFAQPSQQAEFYELHEAPWNRNTEIDPYFSFYKISGSFPSDVPLNRDYYDIIYFDAFAPDTQPDLWNIGSFQFCFDILKKGGYWISFSAKGSVRRNLAAVGFRVEKLAGPPGKREITRAIKPV